MRQHDNRRLIRQQQTGTDRSHDTADRSGIEDKRSPEDGTADDRNCQDGDGSDDDPAFAANLASHRQESSHGNGFGIFEYRYVGRRRSVSGIRCLDPRFVGHRNSRNLRILQKGRPFCVAIAAQTLKQRRRFRFRICLELSAKQVSKLLKFQQRVGAAA